MLHLHGQMTDSDHELISPAIRKEGTMFTMLALLNCSSTYARLHSHCVRVCEVLLSFFSSCLAVRAGFMVTSDSAWPTRCSLQ
jgi:hypothetical protein